MRRETASWLDALTLTLSQRESGTLAAGACGVLAAIARAGRHDRLQADAALDGETVLLRVVPVDPRDMFRGDYVALSYDFSRIPPKGIAGLRQADDPTVHAEWQGKTVYVSLVPEEDGKHWRRAVQHRTPPASGQVSSAARSPAASSIECGIESYYVRRERARNTKTRSGSHKLSAEVAIASDGRAALRGLQIEPSRHVGRTAACRRTNGRAIHRWPSDTTYRVRRLPQAKIRLDGRLDEPEWSRANVERHFIFPWKKADAPPTEFLAFCDDQYLYFAFRVEDADIVVLDKLRDKQDEVFEDRVEMIFSRDEQMQDYFCLEIDSRGRVFDYRASYYRQLDPKWHCEGVEAAGVPTAKGYVVEGRIPLATLVEMGFPTTRRPGGNDSLRAVSGRIQPRPQRQARGAAGDRSTIAAASSTALRRIEEWISWIDPKTPEPDFHVPSSLGWLEIVE